jgi:predicted GNAT superfamily acetyltransferase
VPNQYGVSSSPLHRGLPTDRLIAEWWLDSSRVVALACGENDAPADVKSKIEVSLDIVESKVESTAQVSAMQAALRPQFQQAFATGLAALGFDVVGAKGIYLLAPFSTPKTSGALSNHA